MGFVALGYEHGALYACLTFAGLPISFPRSVIAQPSLFTDITITRSSPNTERAAARCRRVRTPQRLSRGIVRRLSDRRIVRRRIK
jgi:hypothetical protein